MFETHLKEAAAACGLNLSEEQVAQFNRYYELLVDWNTRMNLTAITEPKDVAVKHIIDSLSSYDPALFPAGTALIDVGTGAGFPGLPLKIFAPELKLTLVDSLAKRVNFLETVAGELGLKGVRCIHGRAEDLARDKKHREHYDVACARAVARLNVLAEYLMPFVRPGGTLLALKGRSYQEEADEAEKALKILGGGLVEIRPVKLPGLDDVRAILTVKKKKPTPKAYPRKAGTPAKKPLI